MISQIRKIALCLFMFAVAFLQKLEAQSVMNPSDPVLEYNPLSPPTNPDWFHRIVKWVRTKNISNGAVQSRNPGWNSDVYKAYAYGINNSPLAYRVEFPKTYNPTANDGKKYPLIIFLLGQGENDNTYLSPGSPNFDNQWQLLQGPPQFDAAIQNGTYDGYVLAPQLQNPSSGPHTVFYNAILDNIMAIVDSMIVNNKVDPFHIIVNGLSEGGVGSWALFDRYPTYFSAVTPMSSPIQGFVDWSNTGSFFSSKRFTPIWVSQGGKDTHPFPSETQLIVDTMAKYGANFKESYYPNDGHNTWYDFWNEKDFWPFIGRSYSSNPWMIGGLKNWWPGQPINETIGITPGFTGYKWRLNGIIIPTATSNTLQVVAPTGIYAPLVYDAMVQRDGIWSDWSHVPINIRPGFYEAENYVNMYNVQKDTTSDGGSGEYYVGWIGNGSWMDYTINPFTPGTFTLQLRVASPATGGKIQIRNSDSTVLATVNVPNTGGWQNWTTVSTTVTLPAGTQNIRLKSITNSGWNINWLQFSLLSNGALPVNFIYFNAHCNNGEVNLVWKTAQEQNSKNFTVQKSNDGLHWNEIASLPAAYQSNVERSYQFTDNTSIASTNLYRIVEYDLNGRSTISTIVKSNCSSKYELSVYPNPNSGNAVLNISLGQATKITLLILDSKGALMQHTQLMLPAGNTTLPLNMSNFAKGVYSINVNYNSNTKTIKIIKK